MRHNHATKEGNPPRRADVKSTLEPKEGGRGSGGRPHGKPATGPAGGKDFLENVGNEGFTVSVPRMEMTERERRVIGMRDGEARTYREIGVAIGVSAGQARQVYEGAKRMERWLSYPESAQYQGLRKKVYYLLCDNGIRTREKAKRAYEEEKFKDWPGFGRKATREIAEWAGFELLVPAARKPRKCPHCGKAL
jgi:hypothetical protein